MAHAVTDDDHDVCAGQSEGLIVWGQTIIPSGLASVIIATTPIFSILAIRCGSGEPLTLGKVVGMALGVGGTAVLSRGDEAGGLSAAGVAACLGAAVSYGCANAFGRRFRRLGIAPGVGALGQMTATSAMALPCMLALDAPGASRRPGRWSGRPWRASSSSPRRWAT